MGFDLYRHPGSHWVQLLVGEGLGIFILYAVPSWHHIDEASAVVHTDITWVSVHKLNI